MKTTKKKVAAKTKSPPVRAKADQPSGYKPEFAEQARMLCEKGFTDYELAQFFGVVRQTIYNWMSAHPEFLDSIKTGKEISDERVERTLFERACGYTFDSEKVFQFQGSIVRAKTVEHVPPDPTSMIFWLKNRRKEQWRDKQEVEHTGEMTLRELVLGAMEYGKARELAAGGK